MPISGEQLRAERLRLLEGGGEGQQDVAASPAGRGRHQRKHLCTGKRPS